MDNENNGLGELACGANEDQVEECQRITEQLLVILGEAWSRIDLLESQNRILQMGQQSIRESPAPTSPKSGNGVIIIDDSRLMLTRLRSNIESLGFEVVGTADNGQAGAELVINKNPKLVIIDHHMPVMNGLQCLQAFRIQCSAVRVIVCTGAITEELSQLYIKYGVSAIITKPIPIDRFVKAVRDCMKEDPGKTGQELNNLVDSL